jgi:hypothetical protein
VAAPVATLTGSFGFRDAKGQTAKMRVIVGAASVSAAYTDTVTLQGHLGAASNAAVYNTADTIKSDKLVYGSVATFLDVEDKAILTFKDSIGGLHRYQLAAPISACFYTDTETVNPAATAIAAVIADFQSFVYGFYNDTAPLVYIGGTRLRKKLQRKFNIFTKDPTLGITGE